MVNGMKYSIFWDGSSGSLEKGLSVARFLAAIEENFFPFYQVERKDLYFFLDPSEKSKVDTNFQRELHDVGFEDVPMRLIGKDNRENEELVRRLGVYREKNSEVELILVSNAEDYPRPIHNFLEKNSTHCHIVRTKTETERSSTSPGHGKASFFEETESSSFSLPAVEPILSLDLSDDDDGSEASYGSSDAGGDNHPVSRDPRFLAIIKYGRDVEEKLLESLKILDVFKGHLNSCINGIAVIGFSSSEDLKKATPILEGLGETLGLTISYDDEAEIKSTRTANIPSNNGRSPLSTGLISGGSVSSKPRSRSRGGRRNRSEQPGSQTNYGKRYVVTISYKEPSKGLLNTKLSSTLRDLGSIRSCKDGIGIIIFESGRKLGLGKKLLSKEFTEYSVKTISISGTDRDTGSNQASSKPLGSQAKRPGFSEQKNNPGPSGLVKSNPSSMAMNPPTASSKPVAVPQRQITKNESMNKFDPEKCKKGYFLLIKGLQKHQSISFYLNEFKKLLVDIRARPLFISAQLDWAVLGFYSEDQRRTAHIRLVGGGLIGGMALNPKPVESLPDSCVEQMKSFYEKQQSQAQRNMNGAVAQAANGQNPGNPPCSVFSFDDLKSSLNMASNLISNNKRLLQGKAKEKRNQTDEQCAVS